MRDAPVMFPRLIYPGTYECGLSPGTICRPYAGSKVCPVVDECGTPCCALWKLRHNNPWDGFGAALGYRPDDRPGRDDAPVLTVEATA